MHGYCLFEETELCAVCHTNKDSLDFTDEDKDNDKELSDDLKTSDEHSSNNNQHPEPANLNHYENTFDNSNPIQFVDSALERLELAKDKSHLQFITDLWTQNFGAFKAELYDPETLKQESFPDDADILQGYLPMDRHINGAEFELYPCLLQNKE